MRILVTGGSGFAGQHLLLQLCSSGRHEIYAGTVEAIPPRVGALPGLEEVRWRHLDVTSSESVREAVADSQPEWVVHLAGQASVGESFDAPLQTWGINATGTLRLLESLRQEALPDTRVLLVSSAEVYGAVPATEQPIHEDRPLRPLSPYGASKAAAELLGVQASLAGFCRVVISRSFNHIGPGQDDRFVLASFARQLSAIRRGEEEPVLRVGNLEVKRDFLDVRDVVRAYIRLLERGEPEQAYNVCSGRPVSLREIVDRLVALSGTQARVEVEADRVRAVDIPTLAGDPTRMHALGWQPEIPLDQTLSDLLAAAEQTG